MFSFISHFFQGFLVDCKGSGSLVKSAQVGSDSAQGAGSPVMFQAMSRITRWLTRHTPTEGIEERTIRKSFLGKLLSRKLSNLICSCRSKSKFAGIDSLTHTNSRIFLSHGSLVKICGSLRLIYLLKFQVPQSSPRFINE